MGLGGVGISELLLILAIVVLLFGTRRLGSLGSDLGTAIRGFRKAMQPGAEEPLAQQVTSQPQAGAIAEARVETVGDMR